MYSLVCLVAHMYNNLYTEPLGFNDLFTARVWNDLQLVGFVTCLQSPCRAYSLYFMRFHRGDESNKGQDCHTPSRIRQSTQPLSPAGSVNLPRLLVRSLSLLGGNEHLLQHFCSIFLLLGIVKWTKEEYENEGKTFKTVIKRLHWITRTRTRRREEKINVSSESSKSII